MQDVGCVPEQQLPLTPTMQTDQQAQYVVCSSSHLLQLTLHRPLHSLLLAVLIVLLRLLSPKVKNRCRVGEGAGPTCSTSVSTTGPSLFVQKCLPRGHDVWRVAPDRGRPGTGSKAANGDVLTLLPRDDCTFYQSSLVTQICPCHA